MMQLSVIHRIRDNYDAEYNELKVAATRKHKNHQVLIFRASQQYREMLKDEVSINFSSDDSEAEALSYNSLNSEDLDDDYKFIQMLNEAQAVVSGDDEE